jgi:DNA-binding IscR family transcriptional regulator
MSANSRLTIATHALAWMALARERGQAAMTSEQVAASVNTNAVVVRRSLGDLRRAGLVEVRPGPGAGWSLAREPAAITLLEVFEAVGPEPVFALHHSEPNLECPVGHGIRPALGHVYDSVDRAVRAELGRTSVAEVLRRTLAG